MHLFSCHCFTGKWVYELMLGSKGVMQVGWCTIKCKFSQEVMICFFKNSFDFAVDQIKKFSLCMTKPSVRSMQPAKTQISLHIRAVRSESLLIPCVFYRLQAIQRGINENPCHSGLMYRLI